jgi:hypothetical protein
MSELKLRPPKKERTPGAGDEGAERFLTAFGMTSIGEGEESPRARPASRRAQSMVRGKRRRAAALHRGALRASPPSMALWQASRTGKCTVRSDCATETGGQRGILPDRIGTRRNRSWPTLEATAELPQGLKPLRGGCLTPALKRRPPKKNADGRRQAPPLHGDGAIADLKFEIWEGIGKGEADRPLGAKAHFVRNRLCGS